MEDLITVQFPAIPTASCQICNPAVGQWQEPRKREENIRPELRTGPWGDKHGSSSSAGDLWRTVWLQVLSQDFRAGMSHSSLQKQK